MQQDDFDGRVWCGFHSHVADMIARPGRERAVGRHRLSTARAPR